MSARTDSPIFISERMPRYCPQCGTDMGEASSFVMREFQRAKSLIGCACGIQFMRVPAGALYGICEAMASLADEDDHVAAASAMLEAVSNVPQN